MCRWGIQELAGSAALLASELITAAVVHDQDPNVARLLTAEDGADQRLDLPPRSSSRTIPMASGQDGAKRGAAEAVVRARELGLIPQA
jgi:hypothetical protein